MSASTEVIVQQVTVWALPVLFALTLSEVAHGWAARALGDRTAEKRGELSLNPLKHIDPVGTLVVPGILVVMTTLGVVPFPWGWSRPVSIDYRGFKHPRRNLALISAAGPIASVVMAIAWACLLRAALSSGVDSGVWDGLRQMGEDGVVINLVLLLLSLLPIPPRDGGRILVGVLPRGAALRLARVEPYGNMIILVLWMVGILLRIIAGPLAFSVSAVKALVGL